MLPTDDTGHGARHERGNEYRYGDARARYGFRERVADGRYGGGRDKGGDPKSYSLPKGKWTEELGITAPPTFYGNDRAGPIHLGWDDIIEAENVYPLVYDDGSSGKCLTGRLTYSPIKLAKRSSIAVPGVIPKRV